MRMCECHNTLLFLNLSINEHSFVKSRLFKTVIYFLTICHIHRWDYIKNQRRWKVHVISHAVVYYNSQCVIHIITTNIIKISSLWKKGLLQHKYANGNNIGKVEARILSFYLKSHRYNFNVKRAAIKDNRQTMSAVHVRRR